MKKRGGFALIEAVVAFITLAVLVVGVYTVWQRPTVDEPTTTPTVIPSTTVTEAPTATSAPTQAAEITATPTPNPTAGWEVYRHETFHYLLKYPHGSRVAKSNQAFNSFELYFGEPGTLAGSYPAFRVEVANNPSGMSRRYFLADRLGTTPESALPNFHITEEKVGGVDALQIVLDSGNWQGSGPHTVHVVPQGLKMYLLWSELYVGGRDESGVLQLHEGSHFTELDQIISTFQFTD